MSLDKVPNREGYYTYRCQYCGAECIKIEIPMKKVGRLPKTKLGDYGSNATPTPVDCDEEMYETDTISFTAAVGDTPAKINDSALKFGDKGFLSGMTIVVESTSGLNDGTYTIRARGVTRGSLSLSDSDSLHTETASAAGTVTLKRRIKKPGTMVGCSFCGSLNSR